MRREGIEIPKLYNPEDKRFLMLVRTLQHEGIPFALDTMAGKGSKASAPLYKTVRVPTSEAERVARILYLLFYARLPAADQTPLSNCPACGADLVVGEDCPDCGLNLALGPEDEPDPAEDILYRFVLEHGGGTPGRERRLKAGIDQFGGKPTLIVRTSKSRTDA